MKKNLLRKSYFFNKIYIRKTTRFVNIKKRKKRKAISNNEIVNNLYIKLCPNNTFITMSGAAKLHNITAGSSGFKGPKRSSPFSRHVVARNMSYYIFFKKISTSFDLYFNSMITKKFFFFFKGLVVKPFNVRYIIRKKMIAHGYIRPTKKRRT